MFKAWVVNFLIFFLFQLSSSTYASTSNFCKNKQLQIKIINEMMEPITSLMVYPYKLFWSDTLPSI